MSRTISIGFGVFALILTSLLVIPRLVDLNKWKPEIQTLASTKLGRDVRVNGDVSLIILPYPGITLSNVHISNADWSQNPEMVQVEEVTVTVALLPLITKTLEFSQISLIKPHIILESDSKGRQNWDFLNVIVSNLTESDPSAVNKNFFDGWSLESIIPRINVLQGELTYSEGSQVYEIRGFRTALKSNSVKGPYAIKGGLIFNDQNFEFKVDSGEFKKDLPLTVDTNIQSDNQRIQVIGNYNLEKKEFVGQLASKLYPDDLTGDFANILGNWTVTADLKGVSNEIKLSNLVLSTDNIKVVGDANLNLGKVTLCSLSLDGFPGQTRFSLGGSITKLTQWQGKAEIFSDSFPTLLSWLLPLVETYPELKMMKLNADYAFNDGSFKVSNIDLDFNEHTITGAVDVNLPEIKLELATPKLSSWLNLIQPENTGFKISQASFNGSILLDEQIAVNTKLSFANGFIHTEGNFSLADKSYQMTIETSHPDFREILTLLGVKIGKLNLGSLNGKVDLSGDTKGIKFSGLEGSFKPAKTDLTISGNGSINLEGEKPYVLAEISLGRVGFYEILAEAKIIRPQIMLASTKALQGQTPTEWSTEEIIWSPLKKFDAELDLKTSKLDMNNLIIDNCRVPLKLKNGDLIAETIEGSIAGGTIKGTGSLENAEIPRVKLNLEAKNVSLDKDISTADADIKITSFGISTLELVSNLEGEINFSAKDVKVGGFDAGAFEKAIKAKQFVDINKAFSPQSMGRTKFDNISMRGLIEKGIMAIDHIQIKGPNLEGQGVGTINLIEQTVDISNILTFINLENAPAFKVSLVGSMYQPQKVLDAASLSKYLLGITGRKALEKVITSNDKNLETESESKGTIKSLIKGLY